VSEQDAGSAKDLLYSLVRVGNVEGVLSGIKQDGTLFLRQDNGMQIEVRGTPRQVKMVCSTCRSIALQKLYDGLCADCERTRAKALPKPRETCEECGALGAYYSPAAKKFRCANCHARHLSNSGYFAESRAREALAAYSCSGQEVDDPRHQWVHMRGTRFHCRICKSKTFQKPRSFISKEDLQDDVPLEEDM